MLFACEKEISSIEELIDANLNATSNNNWEGIVSQSASYNIKTLINGSVVNDENTVLSQKFPGLQKKVSSKKDTITKIILTKEEESKLIKFTKGTFFGISRIPKEEIQISPVLDLKKKSAEYGLIDSIWNNQPVFFANSKKNNDSYIFSKQSKMLIAYLAVSQYGKSTLTFEDYREVGGYQLSYRQKLDIPDAGYSQEFIYQNRRINPEFPKNHFQLNDEWKALTKGSEVPSFELPMAFDENKMVSTQDLKGKVTLIDFWATWCKPCLEELPTIKEQYNIYKSRGFEVVSISIDKDVKRLNSFLNKNPFPWKLSLYSDGEFNSELAKSFQLVAIPKPILVDENGNIIAMDAELTNGKLEVVLKNIFSSKSNSSL
ncbi:MAG: TlpA disulfide reductase family protein [Bacteroidota bacterium]